jgi:hypothetical protein
MMMAPFVLALLLAAQVSAQRAAAPGEDPQALLKIRRVFVDRLTGGETAAHIRDMIISSLQNSKLFIITENEDRADTFLRGAAEDLIFTDKFNTSEGINAHATVSDRVSSNSRGRYASAGVGDNESSHIEERKHEATAAVRLVTKDGDVIWSTTQESLGGKFRGASADVADRITKQLIADYERAKKQGLTGQSALP